ncbi:hypothetical protein I79_010657 [Cricetulus griseus]|uniref:Uncharacterized protein n=1 Tax=Cricetulus griseus TaxID=10029 RepID=G3HJ23_CRIGR|nr:hypothetical protein I79_010657 [Cricetulus griseus]
MMKHLNFLESFLGCLTAQQIKWLSYKPEGQSLNLEPIVEGENSLLKITLQPHVRHGICIPVLTCMAYIQTQNS